MKRIFTIIMFVIALSINACYASDLNKITDNSKLLTALKILEANGQNDVINRIETSKTKVMFYDLTMISFSYSKHYAVSSTDEYGDNYILINSNLSSSPVEALACLIAHESVHQLPQATFEEEVKATTTEAKTWSLLKDNVSEKYQNDRLVKRLNGLVAMQQSEETNLIAKAISNNAFYQTQLAK